MSSLNDFELKKEVKKLVKPLVTLSAQIFMWNLKRLFYFLDEDPSVSVVADLPKGKRKADKLDLTFLDHHAAFKNKSTWEVFRAYVVFQLCGIKFLVDNNERVRLKIHF